MDSFNPEFIQVKKSTVYQHTSDADEATRERIIKNAIAINLIDISKQPHNELNPFRPTFSALVKAREQEMNRLEQSILWSRRYTPTHFKFQFLLPFSLFALSMLYMRYVAHPKRMLNLKAKYGIQFPQLQAKGYLDGWLDELQPKDPILEFDKLLSVADLDSLDSQGQLQPQLREVPREQKKDVVLQKTYQQLFNSKVI